MDVRALEVHDTDLANGSHTGSNYSARGELNPGLLIIHEPDEGESRLPMAFAGEARNTRLTLGKMTYGSAAEPYPDSKSRVSSSGWLSIG